MRRFLLGITLSSLIALPATAAETVDAVWREQRIEFTYLSLEAAYSCELMEARIKMLLRHVGAADDVEVGDATGGADVTTGTGGEIYVLSETGNITVAADDDGTPDGHGIKTTGTGDVLLDAKLDLTLNAAVTSGGAPGVEGSAGGRRRSAWCDLRRPRVPRARRA